ncbi:MAG: hypothetical protein ACRDSH_02570, partial [Pseudonocardiaceae bacterium]
MTAGSNIAEVQYDRLVTPDFAPLADFAGFGSYEAMAVQETGKGVPALSTRLAEEISRYLMIRPESAPMMAGTDRPIDGLVLKEWLDRTIAGPFDGELATMVRRISHLPGAKVTFPGVLVPLPPQLVLALMAWVEGRIMTMLGENFDVAVVSASGAAWMNQFMLQLGIMLEPCLSDPDGPLGRHDAAEFHPYAEFAGFGAKESGILRRTGPLLGPAAGGVVALAYDYLLSRPESAGYFQDTSHLVER